MKASFWDTIGSTARTREANVETWLVLPLLEALGHERTCIDSKAPVYFQEGRRKRPGRKPEADFVVYAETPFDRVNSLIVVETKRTDKPLDGGRQQGESYAHNLGAPILVMTNGLRFEIWQMQVTGESVRLLDCDVSELTGRRGDVEALLSKEAIKAHCASIVHKRFDSLARDLSTYECAEYERVASVARSAIPRTLSQSTTERSIDSLELLDAQPRGAVVVGSSGYGKTTLAAYLLLEGLERRWKDTTNALPFDIYLPDASLDGRAFEEFLADRVASHKPGFTLATLHTVAREQGLLVIADGFERVAPDRRDHLESAFRTLLRDYPKTRLFVMSRAQAAPLDLGLPILSLNGYTSKELTELARRRSPTHPEVEDAFIGAPDHVYRMAEVPLLADLMLDRYTRERGHTTRVASLYEAWLQRILAASRPIDRALDRALLGAIAVETTSGAITIERAIELGWRHSDPERTLRRLAEADAISVRGKAVELQHEGLADYLRALQFWDTSPTPSRIELDGLAFDPSSQFAVLILATGPTANARGDAWLAIARADMQLAIRSLRFAAGDDTFAVVDAEGEARRLLKDIQATIETLVTAHLEPIGNLVRETIAGVPVERLGIRGAMLPDDIVYSFFEAQGASEIVCLDSVKGSRRVPRRYGHALRRMGYGPEAGRIFGARRVIESLAELAKTRRLRGGPVWTEERVFGRLRHLAQEYDLSVSSTALEEAYDTLRPDVHTWVGLSNIRRGQSFPMSELLDDIAWLIERGVSRIASWWDDPRTLDLQSISGKSILAHTLDEYHRRRQLAYAEVVKHSFPALRPYLRTLRMMPLRFEIEAEVHAKRGFEDVTLYYRRWPVQNYDDAGADVTFPDEISDYNSTEAIQAYGDQTDALMARFGRSFPGQSWQWGGSRMPDLQGRDTTFDGLPDESAVVRGAIDWLKRDLEDLFSEMPTYRLS